MQATLKEKLTQTVKTKLQGEADLETLSNGHVCGHVISRLFDGLDYSERRQKIREALESAQEDGGLSGEDLLQVSTLLTYTPDEWSVVSTDVDE